MDHCSAPDLGWSKCVALLGGHGAHVALVDRAGANGWHCQVGMEHIGGTSGQTGTTCMYGIDGQTENTHMAVMDRLGACRSLMDREHRYGTDGQMDHMCGTQGQTGTTCVAVMDRQGTCGGINRQTRSRNMALLGEHGAHMWH